MGADATVLELGMYDKLTNMNITRSLFDADIAARDSIAQNDFMGSGGPSSVKKLVLRLLVPGTELDNRDIMIGAMMCGAG